MESQPKDFGTSSYVQEALKVVRVRTSRTLSNDWLLASAVS
jgi:hypothetical protein